MAEGGYDFENTTFDTDDIDDIDTDDEEVDKFLDGLGVKNQETQRIANQQMESMPHQTGETLEDSRKK